MYLKKQHFVGLEMAAKDKIEQDFINNLTPGFKEAASVQAKLCTIQKRKQEPTLESKFSVV